MNSVIAEDKIIKVKTISLIGMEAITVQVEVKVSPGLPRFTIVGLPDAIVSESRIRISSALQTALPPKNITVNLSPANIKKEGNHFDLPIAIGVLAALNIIPGHSLEDYLVMGELSLSGEILTVCGALVAGMHANENKYNLICPKSNAKEAMLAGGDLEILSPENLVELINYFNGNGGVAKPDILNAHFAQSSEAYDLDKTQDMNVESRYNLDFSQIKGQESAKRAMKIAAAGGHHILLVGPPGSGKSMLASRMNTILPKLEAEVALESTLIHSLAGKLADKTLIVSPVFRDPHHSASMAALIGGGSKSKPGEISLSHGGVLFLDELPEFSRQALESLRQPMEEGKVTISRAESHYTYPAKFQLVAAMNPCKCGMFDGAGKNKCALGVRCSEQYWARLSGPLLDRFDLFVRTEKLKPWELSDIDSGDNLKNSSKYILRLVKKVRALQLERQQCLNAHLSQEKLESVVNLDDECRSFVENVARKYELSGRGYFRLLKVARTIADIRIIENEDDKDNENVIIDDLAEAVSFKLKR